MMEYLHLFSDSGSHDAVYDGSSYSEPWVAYIEDDELVTYNKPKAKVGDIIYYDGTLLKFTSKNKWNSSLGTPVAVVVIPASHMSDGKCRGMSLCNMSYKTPQTGTLMVGSDNAETNGTNLMYGKDEDITGLTNYREVKTISGTTTFGYFPSDLFDGGYHSEASNSQKCMSPYNDDDSQNPAYLTEGQALADMDGKANTEALVSASAIKDTYSSGAFENVIANYPAAFACHLFRTDGTKQGDWYLPTIGEMGYLWVRAKAINESLAKIGTLHAVQVGNVFNDPENISLGYWYHSSSESSAGLEWILGYVGRVNANSKLRTNTNLRVRAFAAFNF